MARFSFGVLASLIFVIYFIISSFTSTNNSLRYSRFILNFYTLPSPLNKTQKEEYTRNTSLLQKKLLANILSNKCSLKPHKIHRKTPLLESLFSNVAGLKTWNFIKTRLRHIYFPVNFACSRWFFHSNESPIHWSHFVSFFLWILIIAILGVCSESVSKWRLFYFLQ